MGILRWVSQKTLNTNSQTVKQVRSSFWSERYTARWRRMDYGSEILWQAPRFRTG